jgi:hypothetical protein
MNSFDRERALKQLLERLTKKSAGLERNTSPSATTQRPQWKRVDVPFFNPEDNRYKREYQQDYDPAMMLTTWVVICAITLGALFGLNALIHAVGSVLLIITVGLILGSGLWTWAHMALQNSDAKNNYKQDKSRHEQGGCSYWQTYRKRPHQASIPSDGPHNRFAVHLRTNGDDEFLEIVEYDMCNADLPQYYRVLETHSVPKDEIEAIISASALATEASLLEEAAWKLGCEEAARRKVEEDARKAKQLLIEDTANAAQRRRQAVTQTIEQL